MHIGMQLSTLMPFENQSFDPVGAAVCAETEGFDGVYVGDHLTYHVPVHEAIVTLAAASAVTTTIALGTAALLPALRGSGATLKQISTLQELSGGRLVLGVGLGGEYPPEWEFAGVPKERRGRLTDDFLKRLRGQDYATLEPRQVIPPVLIGGRSNAALRRAAAFGDEWLAIWMSAARVAESMDEINALRTAGGGGPIGAALSVIVHSTDVGDERDIDRFLAGMYNATVDTMGKYVISGTPEHMAAQLGEFVDAGVTRLIFIPAHADPVSAYPALARVGNLVKEHADVG